jgi:biopolymer transport protein ExbD
MAYKKKKKAKSEGCEGDMTPMIDVVFQLIIFFIVTLKMDENKKDIILDDTPHAMIQKEMHPLTVEIEVDKKGRISMKNVPFRKKALHAYLVTKYKKYGEYPILIRGDYRSKHTDIRGVMDLCTKAGLWRINFASVQERKIPKGT